MSKDRTAPERQLVSQLSVEEETALIERVLAGDREVFGFLMKHYTPMVIGYLSGRVQSYHDCEDLLQEIFFVAYHRLETLRRLDKFGPWLMKIAETRYMDFLREQYRRQRTIGAVRNANARNEDPLRSSYGPIENVSAKQVQDSVQRAISQMGRTYRTVLYMRLIGEETPEEIARHLGLKQSTVRMRLLRGLKKLRRTLERRGL